MISYYQILPIHILFGSLALLSSIGAILSQKGGHKHRLFGKGFFIGMTGIFITALPLAYLRSNLFLALIAIFSYYLAYTGWRYARRKTQPVPFYDWLVTLLVFIISLIMLGLGLSHFNLHQFEPMVLLVFGFLCLSFSGGDVMVYFKGKIPGKERIARHLSAMLGGTIAVFTAVLVTNVHIKPAIVLWLGPTVIITPLIIYWNNKMRKGITI